VEVFVCVAAAGKVIHGCSPSNQSPHVELSRFAGSQCESSARGETRGCARSNGGPPVIGSREPALQTF
jgi:hypothetical protein